MKPTPDDPGPMGGADRGRGAGSPPPPERRPIPLPPDSLRPPPRARPAAAPPPPAPGRGGSEAQPPPSTPPARRRGASRRVAAFGIPVAAALAAAVFLGRHPERAAEPGGTGGDGSPPSVTPRTERIVPPPDPSPEGSPAAGDRGSPAPPTGSPSAPGTFTLQVGSYRTRGKAASVLGDVEAGSGLEGAIVPAGSDDDRWYRILLGSFPSEKDARARGDSLVRARILDEARVRRNPSP